MVHKKHKDGSSKAQVKRIEKQAQHFKLVDNRLFYRRDIEDDFYSLEYPKIAVRNSIAMDAHMVITKSKQPMKELKTNSTGRI
jgi:hypothetical protein